MLIINTHAGCPPMQAQVMSAAAAQRLLADVPRRKGQDIPVMFFGSRELALVGKNDVASLAQGLELGYINKGKGAKTFQLALAEVSEAR